MKHTVNIGKHERRLRIGLGILLIGIGGLTALPEWGSLVAFFLGGIALYTGIHHFFPMRKWLGTNTCGRPHNHHEPSQINEVQMSNTHLLHSKWHALTKKHY